MMFNVLTTGAEPVSLETFLGYGTDLLEWIGKSMLSFLDTLMQHPVTAVFLIIGLVYVVIGIVRRFTN